MLEGGDRVSDPREQGSVGVLCNHVSSMLPAHPGVLSQFNNEDAPFGEMRAAKHCLILSTLGGANL